ncbi:glycosyltransferase [Terriglobus sp. RCC_193]|uniref:glycosyltransferase n=1 Tax=Terriglobus sp. RCC_193 TaxID=3239218 RepID=UPI003524940E
MSFVSLLHLTGTGLLSHILFWIAALGSLTALIFCGMAVMAALRFAARRRRALQEKELFTPPLSLLKPLHGAEPGLEQSIESFFRQDYPAPYEIIFCARHQDDAGIQIAYEVSKRYPDRAARFYACGEPLYPNPKMFSLGVMSEVATYPHLITSDADARVSPDALLRCIQSIAPGHTVNGKQVVLGSCLYVGHVDRGTVFTWLDAVGKTVEMGAGVLIADMLSGTDFALGVTMMLEKKTFSEAGGYEDLGHYWAEDFVLGHRLAEQGKGVEMSTHVIKLVVADQGVVRSFRDQLRWMQSTRRSRPAGHFGTGLTFAMPFGLIGFALEAALGNWCAAWVFLGIALMNRWLQAFTMLRVLGAERIAFQTSIYPVRDLLGFIVWCCSYLPADTSYHGTHFRIMPDGRLKADG